MADTLRFENVTITAGQSVSSAIGLNSREKGNVVGFATDVAWDPQAMTFQGSFDGVTWRNLYSDGIEVNLAAVPANSMQAVDPLAFLPARYVRIRSGTAAVPVAQAAATTITVVTRAALV